MMQRLVPTAHLSARLFACAAVCLLLAAAGCREPEPPPSPAAPQPVKSPEAGIRLSDLPEGFRLVAVNGGEILLERKPELPPGTAVVTATPVQTAGVNLFAAVNEQKEEIESRPDGKFYGQTELGSHLGTAFLTRGRWTENGQEMEEMRLFSLHPQGNRMLVITYRYALSGDTKDRAEQAMEILGMVEGLEAPPAEGSPEGASEEGSTEGSTSP